MFFTILYQFVYKKERSDFLIYVIIVLLIFDLIISVSLIRKRNELKILSIKNNQLIKEQNDLLIKMYEAKN